MDQNINKIRKPIILLVDDNETYRKINKNVMIMEGFDVLEAINGSEALTLIQTNPPDLILCDVYMPNMDGLTFLGQLKKDPSLGKIPVVMVTNVQEELDKAVKAGAEEAVLKSSVTPKQIVEVCRKHLQQ
jgi:CheY-like chemotaxis protein